MSQTLTMSRGNVRTIRIRVFNSDGTAADLTGKRLIFTAKESPTSGSNLISKSSATGGITISSPATGVGTMQLASADTSSIGIGSNLTCSIVMDDNPGNEVTIYKGIMAIEWGSQ
jgi:hypothetical protein